MMKRNHLFLSSLLALSLLATSIPVYAEKTEVQIMKVS